MCEKQIFIVKLFTNRKFSSSETKLTDGQMALTFYKYDIKFKTHDTKTHATLKDKKLVPQNNQ